MKIHEYQAKKLLKQYGINVPEGRIAYTPQEAKSVAGDISFRGPWFLKAQIHSGNRQNGHFLEDKAGKKGGIRLASSRREVFSEAEKMLGSTLVTSQTGKKGCTVTKLYVEKFAKIRRRFYISLVIDRVLPAITLLLAETETDDIMKMCEKSPEKLMRIPLDFKKGITSLQIKYIARFLKVRNTELKNLKKLVDAMFKMFLELDLTMIELNPAGITKNGEFIALDAKITIDENALFRHPDLKKLKDNIEQNQRQRLAEKYGFQYVDLDGKIGCIVNGEGLALNAIDMIESHGEDVACFLNIKGGVDKEKIISGIKIIVTNPRVEGILINVLGGFLRCNLVADGILSAAAEVGINVPLVVRFVGTNEDEAKDIITNAKLPIIIAENMEDSVEKLVNAIRENA